MGVQQCLIHPDSKTKAILEYLCNESNKVHNCAVYYARQMWFKSRVIVSGFDLVNEMRRSKNRHFQALNSDAAAQVCLSVGEAMKSFRQLMRKSWAGELEQKPCPPSYRRSGYQTLTYPARRLKLVGDQIKVPLGRQVQAWFGLDELMLPMPSNLLFADIKEVRILPRNGVFYAEFVYPVERVEMPLDSSKCLGLDHGINNWLTGVSNVGDSFVVDGKHLKSINQWYNKQVAKYMEGKVNGFWSKRLANLTEKRNRQMRDAVNKAARLVVNQCLEKGIGTIVFGWNQRQKDSIKLGRKTNQSFVQIPTGRLKERIKQLCEQYGIRFCETEESYTSKASFLDADKLPVYGEKPGSWEPSGRRILRGLYRSALGFLVNADCNGAANILRKVAVKLGLDLSGISRGDLTAPLRLKFWAIQESPSL